VMGQVGGILVPVALLWLALSTYRSVHWMVPVLASVPFGTGTYFIFTSSFTYIVVAYRPLAASALACNATMRTAFAAAFPLFAGQMYCALGTVGATLLLAGQTAAMAPIPYVYFPSYPPTLPPFLPIPLLPPPPSSLPPPPPSVSPPLPPPSRRHHHRAVISTGIT
jgi:hypothetical protein